MMSDLLMYKGLPRNRFSSFLIWKERILYLFLFFFFSSLVVSLFYIDKLNKSYAGNSSTMFRTQDEYIHAGRRFVGCLYGLDSSTILLDQLCAINMMVLEVDRKARTEYLRQHDIIRVSQSKSINSFLYWESARVEFSDNSDGTYDVSVKAKLEITGLPLQMLHIIVTVTAIDISDNNSLGVGVVRWRDVAKEPFSQEEKV